jgi:hypothetical protein
VAKAIMPMHQLGLIIGSGELMLLILLERMDKSKVRAFILMVLDYSSCTPSEGEVTFVVFIVASSWLTPSFVDLSPSKFRFSLATNSL